MTTGGSVVKRGSFRFAPPAVFSYHEIDMPLFHWIFCSALTLLALLLIGSQLTKARKKRVEENLETCGVCGEPRPADRLVERTFASGYRRRFCGACAADLYHEAMRQGLINDENIDS